MSQALNRIMLVAVTLVAGCANLPASRPEAHGPGSMVSVDTGDYVGPIPPRPFHPSDAVIADADAPVFKPVSPKMIGLKEQTVADHQKIQSDGGHILHSTGLPIVKQALASPPSAPALPQLPQKSAVAVLHIHKPSQALAPVYLTKAKTGPIATY
jgi:hypothetical protein